MSINRVMVTGNLTKDPELRSTSSGMSVLKMRMAVNDRRKNQGTGEWEDVPNYFDVTVFGGRADGLSRFLSKGSKVAVEGKLRWHEWETPAGEKRSAVEIVADDVEFLSSRGEGGGRGFEPAASPAAPADDLGGEEIPF
jgi:single-strand DNA-binding protein